MGKIFKNKIAVLLIGITVSVSVILGVINAFRTKSTIIENIAMVTVTPIQNVFSWMGDNISGFFARFGDIEDLRAENEKLKGENRKLAQEKRKIQGMKTENDELRKLLELDKAYPENEMVAAEVVSRSTSNWYENFTIDKGTANGLKIGQCVVTADNVLVGRISDIGSTWARVTVVTDPSHSAGAMVIRSGDLGVIEGEAALAESGKCRLSFISKNNDIVIGDYLETSGLGGVYPKGIEIGRVVELKSDVQSISQYAVVEISVNIENISKVMIIT